jgi:hypothetical protein
MKSLKRYWKEVWKKYHNLSQFNKIGKIYYCITLIVFLSFSCASVSAIATSNEILSRFKLPAGFISLSLSTENQDRYFFVSYEIPNSGIFSLKDVKVSLSLRINYINQSNFANISRYVFVKIVNLGTCAPFSTMKGVINGTANDFNTLEVMTLNEEISLFEDYFYFLNYSISAGYFLELIHFKVSRFNINLNCPICGW